jgi:hypothetical protein
MRITKVKKQQWSDQERKFVPFTLVMLHILSDQEISEKEKWFTKEIVGPMIFKVGRYWYPLIGGIAMDEQVFTWYCLKNQDEEARY